MKKKYIDILFNEKYDINTECETISEKIARITENNEPITDGVQMIYTPRSQGVMKPYNIRTDKWEVAQEAMSKVAAAKKGTIQKRLKGTQESQEKTSEREEQQEVEQTE